MICIGDANDPATVLAYSDLFYSSYCAASDNDEGQPPGWAWIEARFVSSPNPPYTTPPYWYLGRITSALVQMYDLVAPLDAARAGRYLERLRRIAAVLLRCRDDHMGFPADPFRGRVMPAWGGYADDRDWRWNTDVVTAGLLTYPMAAFARRVADNPALHAQDEIDDAIRFVTATIETYEAFRPELHFVDNDAQAYFVNPLRYAQLQCNRDDMDAAAKHRCAGYRNVAGKPLAWNENFSMMKALAEAALAGDSALYRGSADATPARLQLATEEAPLLIAKNFTFFDKHLRSKTLSDGTPYFEWDHQQPEPRYIQDVGHGGFELGCLAVLLDDEIRLNVLLEGAGGSERVALSSPLFVRFANTFLRKVWQYDFQNPNGPRNILANDVKGDVDEAARRGENNWGCAGWIPLAQFDPWVWTRCRDVTFKPPGYLQDDNHAALLRYRQFNGSLPT
jgi:hypothetical protein